MINYKTFADCPHDEKITRVLERVATCEKTALYCKKCGKRLTDPKTDC